METNDVDFHLVCSVNNSFLMLVSFHLPDSKHHLWSSPDACRRNRLKNSGDVFNHLIIIL